MNFKETANAENLRVFLSLKEFGEYRVVIYDGVRYDGFLKYEGTGIPVVMTGGRERKRTKRMADHSEGIYSVDSVLHCHVDDIGGVQPERGQWIQIADEDGYMRKYFINASDLETGMVRLELGAVDE